MDNICKVTYVIIPINGEIFESEELSLIESVGKYSIYCGELNANDSSFNKIFSKVNTLNLSAIDIINIFNRICNYEDSKISCIYRVTDKVTIK